MSKLTRIAIIGLTILVLAVMAEMVCKNGLTPALATVFGLVTFFLYCGCLAFAVLDEKAKAEPQPASTEALEAKIEEQTKATALVQQALSFIIQKLKLDQMP